MMQAETTGGAKLVIVTGPSGAGRSTAINALEDAGYEAIDNLPLRLVPRLLEGGDLARPIALGVDPRNRDFSTTGLIELIELLKTMPEVDLSVLYLDCREQVLLARFSETRRRHPLAPAEGPETGIRREFDLLAPIRVRSDTVIDTSDLTVHQLREEVGQWYGPVGGAGLAVSVHSFSYKRGMPHGLDMVFDVRFLRNPYWNTDLRALDGRDERVVEHIRGDARFAPFFDKVLDMTRFLLPAYTDEGKSHLSIAFGCTGGQHRSVALAEILAKTLADDGRQVSIRHRELERRKRDEGRN